MDATDQQALKQAHYAVLQDFYAHVMERTGFDAIALCSGRQEFYFHDDQGPAFRPNPVMVQWLEQQHLVIHLDREQLKHIHLHQMQQLVFLL